MPEFKRSLAVVIGINQYVNGIPELKTAVNDANQLALILGGGVIAKSLPGTLRSLHLWFRSTGDYLRRP